MSCKSYHVFNPHSQYPRVSLFGFCYKTRHTLTNSESAWIINSELSPLTPEECKDIADKGKSKSLLKAYNIAAEGHDLAYFKAMLADHMAAMQEDADEKAEREAKKASKAKRKSGEVSAPAEDEDADEMDVDEDGAGSKPKSKKRKKSIESDGNEKVS